MCLNITNKMKYPKSKRINPTRAKNHPTLRSPTRKVFQVQLYKNNACALLSRILTILSSDWLHHEHCVHGVYEYSLIKKKSVIFMRQHNFHSLIS